MTLPKHIPAFEVTKDTPYLALTGVLWDVFGEYYVNNDSVIKGLYCSLVPSGSKPLPDLMFTLIYDSIYGISRGPFY